MSENARAHIEEAYRLLTAECYRGPSPDEMKPVDGFCGIVEDLKRIDAAIGQRGRSPFAIMADQIDAAYTEIKAARAALSKPYLSGL